MVELSSLAYVVFGVGDLAAWEIFARDIVGFQLDQCVSGDGLALRMDEYAYRILLERGERDDLVAAGWEIRTEAELTAFVAQAREAGAEVTENPALARGRRVEKLYVCQDPNGFTHEFFFGPTILPIGKPFVSRVISGPGFVTGALGIGHILPVSRDYATSIAFYQNVLKLRVSDYIRQEMAPGIFVDATFFHSSTGRHHSLATAHFPSPKILNHLMVEYADMNDVGLAYDRVRRAGIPLVLELGHHPNDQMFSFYVQTPSGFALEIGSGGIVIDDTKWRVVNYSQLSDWGHKRVTATT